MMASALLRSGLRGLVGSPGNLAVLGSLGGVRLVNTVLRTSAGSTSLMEPAPDIFLVYPLLLAMSPLFLRVHRSLWCWRGSRWSEWIFTPQKSGCGLTR